MCVCVRARAQVMGRAYGLPDDVYEEDLDAELAALDEDEFAVEEVGFFAHNCFGRVVLLLFFLFLHK